LETTPRVVLEHVHDAAQIVNVIAHRACTAGT